MLKTLYTITVDNTVAKSHNVNIDTPTFYTFAQSEAEAIGKMILSNFEYKNNTILKIIIS